MGWIEDGLIEDCYDLADEDTTGYFCRILAGAWVTGIRAWRSKILTPWSVQAVSTGHSRSRTESGIAP